MKKIISFLFVFYSSLSFSNDLFIGDSLTYVLNQNYDKKSDIIYIVGSGLNSKDNWGELIKNIETNKYDDVFISLGANDQFDDFYLLKAKMFILNIKNKNNIYWFLPPEMKNPTVNNRVKKIKYELLNSDLNVIFINPSDYFGEGFVKSLNGHDIRTKDGVHYTNFAGMALINFLYTIKS